MTKEEFIKVWELTSWEIKRKEVEATSTIIKALYDQTYKTIDMMLEDVKQIEIKL